MANEIAAAATIRVIDPDNVREILVTGACNVSRMGEYVYVLLTVVRPNAEALMANRMQAPDFVVASRLILDSVTAKGLADSILIQLGERRGAIEPDVTRN